MYTLTYYVPIDAHHRVKQALFNCGAGKMGNYDECCWQVLGQGQFRPLKDSQPACGQLYQLETVAEYKVEMICVKEVIKQVLQTLLQEHPYEQPAYFILPVIDIPK
jgi:hypothetical protein